MGLEEENDELLLKDSFGTSRLKILRARESLIFAVRFCQFSFSVFSDLPLF